MAYTFCPKCSAKTMWAARCASCGARIPLYNYRFSLGEDSNAHDHATYTFCPSCSARIGWAAKCTECGARIPLYGYRCAPKVGADFQDHSHGVGRRNDGALKPG